MIGIWGYGFVGKAVHNLFIEHDVHFYDKYNDSHDPKFVASKENKIMFLCVPTPTEKGQQNIDAILDSIETIWEEYKWRGLFVIKSTILPHHIDYVCEKYPQARIIHVPEFLNEHEPFENQQMHIIGCKNLNDAAEYMTILPEEIREYDIELCDLQTASFIKYMHNIHGCVKVSFFNEMFDVCKKIGINYRTAIKALKKIRPSAATYSDIASDGSKGWGGHCFPKDSVAFDKVYPTMSVKNAINQNKLIRKVEMDAVL